MLPIALVENLALYNIEQGWPTNQIPRVCQISSDCVIAMSHIIHMGIHEHHPISYLYTYLCSARFIVNVTHQHDSDRTLQGICCFACYLVGLLVIT